MRPDMDRVVIERPRHGHKDRFPRKFGRNANRDYEDLSSYSAMGKIDGKSYRSKEFSDLTSPLHRFLFSRVGKPWNEVYSEICANLDRGNVSQAHVFNHLWDNLDTNVWVGEDGYLYSSFKRYGWGESRLSDTLYVCPVTGFLRKTKNYGQIPRHRWQRPGNPDIKITNDTEYRRVGGIWYEVLWAQVLPPYVARDIAGKEYLAYRSGTDYFTTEIVSYPGWYRSGKKQLNRKELRAVGLVNG